MEMRTPGSPVATSSARDGVCTMQNRPVSSVIRWPLTFSSAIIFCACALSAGACFATGIQDLALWGSRNGFTDRW